MNAHYFTVYTIQSW